MHEVRRKGRNERNRQGKEEDTCIGRRDKMSKYRWKETKNEIRKEIYKTRTRKIV